MLTREAIDFHRSAEKTISQRLLHFHRSYVSQNPKLTEDNAIWIKEPILVQSNATDNVATRC